MVFEITHKDKNSEARIGILKTKSGNIETPFFMPVATKSAVKYLDSEDLKELNASAVISNALILGLKPGSEQIEKLGGIKKFMNFHGINVTDSGGFQMYSDSIYINSGDRGIRFKNPFNGEKILMMPEENMKIQLEIGSDIAMCLDSMPLYENSKDEIARSVRKTSLWAERCKKAHDELQEDIKPGDKQLLFGITQGGIYEDLREKSIEELKKLDFDGYSIGGLGLGEKREDEMNIVRLQKKLIPNKPCYLMGIGDPVEILEAISLGVDMFDSRMPTQNARRGTLFSSKGKIKILNKEYEEDETAIDENCNCKVCKNYSKAYIRYLLKQGEPAGKRLASYHNLFYLINLISEAKKAIKENRFSEFKEEIDRSYKE